MSLVDSGARTEFKTGALREIDESVKGRCDLLPLDIMAVLAKCDLILCDDKNTLYDRILYDIDEFSEDRDTSHLIDTILVFCKKRGWDIYTAMLELSIHFAEGAKKYGHNNWRKGLPIHSFIDSGVRHYLKWLRGDTDEPHDRAFLWNMVCCIWTLQNKPEIIDIDDKED